MRESLKSVTAYKTGMQANQTNGSNTSGHFRELSLSDKPAAQDEAEKQLELQLTTGGGDTNEKIQVALRLIQQYGVDMPKIQCLKSASIQLSASPPQDLVSACTIWFTEYLSKKLSLEEMNRLKTEEQSAQVIGQLG